MIELQTMPLRFRVWDEEEERFLVGEELLRFQQDFYQPGNIVLYIAPLCKRYIMSQDTGLKDKNGRHIFIGDIIETDLEDEGIYRGVVCYSGNTGQVMVDYGKEGYGGRLILLKVWLKNHTVIGNVWEDKGLLGQDYES